MTYRKPRFSILLSLIASVALLISCNSSKTLKGGAIGAGAGGAIGGIIGANSDHTAQGAIIGAAVGGAAGAVIGKYMDKQAEELEEDLEGAEVERVGEGIKITFDSGILFGFDDSKVSPEAESNIVEMAEILKKYSDTEILIEGHTDNIGTANYNMKLSEARAEAVALKLTALEVPSSRVDIEAHGEELPVADNDTPEGRQQNRRVEIAIMANEQLKEAAEDGDLNI